MGPPATMPLVRWSVCTKVRTPFSYAVASRALRRRKLRGTPPPSQPSLGGNLSRLDAVGSMGPGPNDAGCRRSGAVPLRCQECVGWLPCWSLGPAVLEELARRTSLGAPDAPRPDTPLISETNLSPPVVDHFLVAGRHLGSDSVAHACMRP